MRTTFINELIRLARQDDRIWLLVGDLGYSVVEPFRNEFPSRFENLGVSEQNMAGVAAGLALSGKVVFVYSIANFPTLRCLEQIRNDICYHHASVKIIAVGGGLAYGSLGMTHHATEDLAVMRALPDMTVAAPGDSLEAQAMTQAAVAHEGPFYIRLSKAGAAPVHAALPVFKLGKAIEVRSGHDITLIASGGMLENAALAAGSLASQGVSVRLLSMPVIKPLDAGAIQRAARETKAILTIEEHSIIGGLGGATAEVLAEFGGLARFLRLGLPDGFCADFGSRDYLLKKLGLCPEEIVLKARSLLT